MAKHHFEAAKLFVVGDARIVTSLGEIDPSSEIIFATGLFLSLEGQHPIGRHKLEQLMWPSAAQAVAAHRLRQTLFKLRRVGFPIHASGRRNVLVPNDAVVVDFQDYRRNVVDDDRLQDRIEVLPGFNPLFSTEYSHWLDARRSEISAVLVRDLLEQIARARSDGRWPTVESKARKLLQHAPENEEATLALSESLAMRGEKIHAVRVLDTYLNDVGKSGTDLRVPAKLLRRRIAEQKTPVEREASIDSPLVGRERFSAALTEFLGSAKYGRPVVVSISGQPGIGKSRLVSDFLSFAVLQGVTCHKVTCRSTDSNRPLAVLLELIPLLRATRGAIGSSPETLEFFDALITHRPNDGDVSDPARSNEMGNAGLDAALLDIVDAVSDEHVVVIAIEDCQWIDSPSAVALTRVFEKLTNQRLLVVLTSRGSSAQVLPALQPRPAVMDLPPLDRFASEELLRAIVSAAGTSLNAGYLQWCGNVAEGNPYFLHELANHWLETRQEHVAPPSLTSVLDQRLSLLTDKSLQLLQTCAILENHATIDNLEHVLGFPAHQLMQSIDELANAGMVNSSPNDSGPTVGRLTSRHDLLSDVALARLSSAARQYLHRRAARTLENLIGDTGDVSTLWSCAKHWQLAGDNAQALRLATSCAKHLLDVGLFDDAADAFSRAQCYCVNDGDLLQNLEGQAIAFYRSSNWHQANETIRSAKALKARLRPGSNTHDDLELMQLRGDWQTMNWNDILSRSLDCLNATTATDRHRIEGGVMALMMLSFSSDKRQATAVSEIIESLQPSVPNLDVLLQARMIFHTNWGSFDTATEAATALLDQHRQRGEAGTFFRSLCNAAVTFRAAGLIAQSKQTLLEAIELTEKHDLRRSKVRALPMLANMALEIGKIDEARHWLDELCKCSIGKDDILANAELSAISARIALLDGKWEAAQTYVDTDLAYMQNDQVPHRRAYVSALRVAVEIGLCQRAQLQSLRDLESAHLRSRANLFQAFPTYALYAGLVSVGKRAKAERVLDEYISQHRREPTAAPDHLLVNLLSCLDAQPRSGRKRKQ